MSEPSDGSKARFQFSIRMMLVTMAAVAAAVGATTAKSDLVAVVALGLDAAFLCSLAILAVTMTTGRFRAFWIGAAVPTAAGAAFAAFTYHAFRMNILYEESVPTDAGPLLKVAALELRSGLPLLWCLAPLNGLLCVFVHWLIWPRPRKSAK